MQSLFTYSYYLYGYIALIFIVMRMPYIGVLIRVFNTLIHELAHALMAILTSGKILKIELQNDTSGSTLSVAKSKSRQLLVAIVGYPASAGFSYFMFWCFANGYNYYLLIGLLVITSGSTLFFVRNSFGVFWCLLFSASIGFILWLNRPLIADFTVVSLALILLLESIYSAVSLFVIAIENPANAGDAKILSTITKIPSLFWALLFVVINGWIVYEIVVNFLIFT